MISSCNFYIINKYKSPDRINIYGDKYWHDENGRWYRDFDLPAIIWNDGTKFWCKHGKYHRVNPITKQLDKNYPAIIYYILQWNKRILERILER